MESISGLIRTKKTHLPWAFVYVFNAKPIKQTQFLKNREPPQAACPVDILNPLKSDLS